MDFSQRMGLAPATKIIQANGMDLELRISLWNVLTETYWSMYAPADKGYRFVRGSNFDTYAKALYSLHYKKPVDTIDLRWDAFLLVVRQNFFGCTWDRVYSFVEFTVEHGPQYKTERTDRAARFIRLCNQVLDRENSAYRFVAGKITEITSPEEIKEIEDAITNASTYAGVTTHLQTSLGFLTNRENPDYRNSIKESISAVESLAKQLVGSSSATLDGALKILENSHKLHPALKKAFSSLYGYTNDSDGIRHALMDISELTKADARFMLICCSAFINFTIDSVEG
ncbi:AbiJ-NTD4 domain-containing protein [Pseudomonas sp. Irchel s3b2]|uniref:AbiJ-NTD4 domain-containing protein n=1 Tax=Pseudomonas sp. Irchel s3b2 TaxID=2009073 RepID=UPI00114002A5|nr:hypothetical protein [Pseudomonas sp. Irchel s3b2]